MVDRNAAAVRVTSIAQGRWYRATAHRHLADDIVQFLGADTRHDMRHQCIEYFGGKAASLAHAFKAFGPVQFDDPVAGLHRLFGRNAYILFHAGDIR